MKKLFALFFIFIFFPGCATQGERSATPSTTFLFESQTLKSGKFRLTCGLSCAYTYGFNRATLKRLHDAQNWEELASEVARIGFPGDQTYYYLGRSMEGSGSFDAAMVYYKLGLASEKCDGWINNCDFVFPEEINNRMLALSKSNGFHKVKPNTLQPVLSSSSVEQQVVAEKVPEDERPKVEPRKQAEQVRRKQAELEAELVAAQQAQVRPVSPVGPALSVHAIVIGNGAYQGSGRLDNPINDARAMSAKLRQMGFKVTTIENATRSKLVSALVGFNRSASATDVSMFFYAGHAAQISGINYMLPTDTNMNDLSEVPLHGVSLNSVIDQYLPGKTKLVFLDACRDNPLLQVASRSVNRGLAPISVSQGTLISYATKDGSVAADGDGKNSPFTKALLQYIDTPEDIAVVLRTVRDQVMRETGGQQQPWEYGSLSGGSLILSAIRAK